MVQVFNGRTANQVWNAVATKLNSAEDVCFQDSRNGPTHEILHAAISISDPRQRWIISRNPPINIAFALAEVIWILAGRNDSGFLNYFNSALPQYCGTSSTYHGAYGYRLRKHFKIDQLERAAHALSKNVASRQVVLQIWDSAVDLPSHEGIPVSPDVPCNIVSMLKVRNDGLEWTQIMRSNDVFRGLPYNIVQFTYLQEILAGWLGIKSGSYNHYSDSLHAYESDLHDLRGSQELIVPETFDSLSLPKGDFKVIFTEMECKANLIVDSNTSASTLSSLIKNCNLPKSYKNILCVLCAEGARRRKEITLVHEIIAECTNAVFSKLYHNWLVRVSAGRIS